MQVIKETILASAFRSLCNAFFGFFGVALALIGLLVFAGSASSAKANVSTQERFQVRYIPDGNGRSTKISESSPVILQITIDDMIGKDSATADNLAGLVQAVENNKLVHTERIKGLLLYINSPGGSVTETYNMYQVLNGLKERYDLPVWVFVDSLCASGGYYLACLGERILATPVSIVGSVGVRSGPHFNLHELAHNLGVRATYVTAGQSKVYLPPLDAWPENPKDIPGYKSLEHILQSVYQQFIGVVLSARASHGLSHDILVNRCGAQIYGAQEAQSLGFIDNVIATKQQALGDFAKVLGIEGPYQVISVEKNPPLVEQLFTNSTNLVKSALGLGNAPQLTNGLLYLYEGTTP